MIKLVAFDLWDTLVYLEQGWKTFTQLKPLISEVLTNKSFWREKVKPLYLFRNQDSPESFLADLKEELNIDLRSQSDNLHYQLDYDLANTQLFEDAIPSLNICHGRGKKLAIISNQCSFYKPSFSTLGLNNFFDFILFSCDLGYGKPDRRIYERLAIQSGLHPSEILVVGDNEQQDYQAPIRYGYNSLHLARSKAMSNFQIRNLKEIADFI